MTVVKHVTNGKREFYQLFTDHRWKEIIGEAVHTVGPNHTPADQMDTGQSMHMSSRYESVEAEIDPIGSKWNKTQNLNHLRSTKRILVFRSLLFGSLSHLLPMLNFVFV